MANEKTNQWQKRSAPVRWHRWVGLSAFAVLVVIAVTGVLLNHSMRLNLDGKRVTKEWVMEWYGMEPEGEPVAFAAGGRLVTGWGGRVTFGDQMLEVGGDLAGAVEIGDEIAVVCRSAVYLLDREGAFLESVSPAMLPDGAFERAGVTGDGELAVRAGGATHVRRGGFFERAAEEEGIAWAEGAEVTAQAREDFARAYRGDGLPLYRVILDLHSGKFFGRAGVVVYDLAAVAVLLLSATGLWLAVRNFYRYGRGNGNR